MSSNIINLDTRLPSIPADSEELDSTLLAQPELYFNRYISLLAYNRRVLAYARDPAVPLLERLKYLCISSSNLDEFFEIRIAVLKQREKSGMLHTGPDNQTPGEILKTLITETPHGPSQGACLLRPAFQYNGTLVNSNQVAETIWPE